jgi:flagellin
MSFSILNNIPALAAENQLNVTNNSLTKTLAELSSGSRINTGADDAAGLAVANGLMANITALTQSAQNASDGVGKLQVADGALSQVTTLLNRAVTLATESANGTLSDTERAPLQAEFASIQAEINRIGSTTNFNGEQVFQSVNANTVVGSAGVSANTSLGGTPLTSYAGAAAVGNNLITANNAGGTWASNTAALTDATDLTGGGANDGDLITLTLTNPGTDAQSSYSYAINSTYGGTQLTTVASLRTILNATGQFTVNAPAGNVLTIAANASRVSLTDASGTIENGAHLGTQNAAQTADTFTIGTTNPYTFSTYGIGTGETVQALMTAVNGDGRYTASIPTSGPNSGDLTIGYGSVAEPSNGTTPPLVVQSGAGTWSFGTGWTTGGASKTFTVQPYGATSATTFVDEGNLTVGALMTDLNAMGLSATLNGNGNLVVADPNNPNNAPVIGGTTTALGNFTAGAQASVAGATDIYLTDDSANPANTIAVAIGALSASSMNGASIASDNLSTEGSAKSALTDISSAINDVAALRGTLGASVNRLQSATNVINNNIQNLTAAENNIMAADIPSTVANMSQNSILEQTGVAALAQANQMQQLVLKLLQ